ncbi:hypothetical protein [Streptomyces sp. NRRL B-24484]|uniref:hypothetical protein n=1 Tax=Streptomyces sp. NRRL B-24484 TaxID=1463833 RepID=UPI0004C28052|nr:hypothetical protein [Streptomyces sp. NRRL B-24484]
MNRSHRITRLTVSLAGVVAAGATLFAAPVAEAAPGGPSGCTAYVSHDNEHNAVGWCTRGSGTWYVKAKCAGPGRVNGPYLGSEGKRSRGMEQASVLSCGSNGWPIEMTVTKINP